ncbi:Alpha-galactosidase [Frankliniella fusca]|uniref:Alpha-galactosidase n=1 Tax=Frankliniella fusca TaxID=407009 RepID=A0AAE1GY72_9NEOP|nr:Alpha-galactosidase [Frankliniella fusca]
MDGKTENIPVSKMRVKNTVSERERSKAEYRHFDPETLTDFQPKKQYYAYSKQGVVPDEKGVVKESLWVCYIGRLAATHEELQNTRMRFPAGLDFNVSESDTSMDEGRDFGDDDDDDDDDDDNASLTVKAPRTHGKSGRKKTQKENIGDHIRIQSLAPDRVRILGQTNRRFQNIENQKAAHVNRCEEFMMRNSDEILDQAEDTVVKRMRELEQALASEKARREAAENKYDTLVQTELSLLKDCVGKLQTEFNSNIVFIKTELETIKSSLSDIKSTSAASSTSVDTGMTEENERVVIGSGISCQKHALNNMRHTDTHADWAKLLLCGVFGEEAHLYRLKPTKAKGFKPFPPNFINEAKALFSDWLVREDSSIKYSSVEVQQLVGGLPGYLSERATSLYFQRTGIKKNYVRKDANTPKRKYVKRGEKNREGLETAALLDSSVQERRPEQYAAGLPPLTVHLQGEKDIATAVLTPL